MIDGLVFENFNASKTGTQNTLILFTVEDDASVKINGLEIKNVNLGVTIPIQVDKQLALLQITNVSMHDSTVLGSVNLIKTNVISQVKVENVSLVNFSYEDPKTQTGTYFLNLKEIGKHYFE